MRKVALATVAVAFALVLPACRGVAWDHDDAAMARKIEMQVDDRGRPVEIEFHVAPDQVPEAVRRAMDELHPGGAFTAAEKEWNDGTLYYELSRTVKGKDVEAMFLPDGTLHEEEIEVNAGAVPETVRAAAQAAVEGGRVDKWEEIRNSARTVFEYHVKMSRGAMRYKVKLSPEGGHLATVREVPAEIEIEID